MYALQHFNFKTCLYFIKPNLYIKPKSINIATTCFKFFINNRNLENEQIDGS